jgi:DNA-binding response OmpR family regulator
VGDEGHVRLLVIDDDPDICELLRVVSEHHPVIDFVAGVSSPEAAVAVVRQSSPDAILLDHHFLSAEPPEPRAPAGIPRAIRGLTGLEAIEFLRAVAPAAVIAVYTGTTGLEGSVLNAGADMYLVKGPNPRAALDEVAAHVVRQRR